MILELRIATQRIQDDGTQFIQSYDSTPFLQVFSSETVLCFFVELLKLLPTVRVRVNPSGKTRKGPRIPIYFLKGKLTVVCKSCPPCIIILLTSLSFFVVCGVANCSNLPDVVIQRAPLDPQFATKLMPLYAMWDRKEAPELSPRLFWAMLSCFLVCQKADFMHSSVYLKGSCLLSFCCFLKLIFSSLVNNFLSCVAAKFPSKPSINVKEVS